MNRKLFLLGCLLMLGTAVFGQAPVAQFTANVTAGCAPLVVRFTDQSTNQPTSWEWDFGDGQTSSAQSPQHSYPSPGTYTVTLIARNASGAGAVRDSNLITVYASPSVSFGVNPSLYCAPATVQFLQYSQAGQGTITNYAWTFGDGTTGSGPTPQHTYTAPGYYNVNLTVTNSGGCTAGVTYQRMVRLVSGVAANFAWSPTGNTCAAPYTLNFLNQTSGPGNMTYNWSFGGGASPANSSAASPTNITYPTTGNYSVTLMARSSLGCGDTVTQTVPLTANTASIIGPASGCVNTPLSFTDSASPAPASVSWNFGDGKPGSNQPTASHTYTTPGTYTITLTANYPNCSSTTTSNITIGASLVPSFSGTPLTSCQAPLTVQFSDNDNPPDNQWTWNFGDGTPPVTGSGNPSHTYSAPGTYNVSLTATNSSGCTGGDTISSYVNITAPVINVGPQGACQNKAYTPNITVTTVDPVATYSWNAPGATPSFGSSSMLPVLTFPTTGSYTVTLTITTNSGCTATQTFPVQVGTPASASFTYNPPTPICGTAKVSFIANSTPGDQYSWNFGGGNTDTGQSVSYRFKHFGNDSVTLFVNNGGCVTDTLEILRVNPPIPDFGWVVNCANNNVTFVDSTLVGNVGVFGPITYDWDFGDSTPHSSSQTPTHAYPPGYGQYPVTLTVTQGSCPAQAFKTVLLQTVSPSFKMLSPNPVCNQQEFTLQSYSVTQPMPTGNSGYIWGFGPGDSIRAGSTLQTHFRDTGTYNTTLTVLDLNGCRYTSLPTAITVVAPNVKFTGPPGGCDDSTITFQDNSTPSALGTAISQFTWNFGDGTQQTFAGPPFTHRYADTGTYTVIESVVDNAIPGCGASDTVVNAVQITAPHPLFIEPDSFYCPNTPATFTNLSTGYGLTYSWNFGDNTPISTLQTPQHSFPSANGATYPVTLTITDKYGCTMDTTENIRIDSPVAAFTIADTTAICAPLQTMFTGSPLYADSLYWEFGDGQTLALLDTVSHYYNSLDTFTATFVVQGPGGCRDSASRKVYLTNPATTTFNFTPKTACDSVVAQFTILPPDYTTFTLQFGDNTADSSGNTSPVHTYRSPNRFLPILYLTDATGCIVSRTDTVLTVLGAVPFFTATPTAFCDTGTVTFIDYTITNNGVQSKTYTFGDGTSDQQNLPGNAPFNTSKFYSTPGNMIVTLNVVTMANCAASYTDTIRVYQTPQPIVSDTGNLCQGLVQFQGKLVVPEVDTVFWDWNFSNGQTATGQNPLVKLNSGTYSVNLKAYVSYGCSDTASATVTINPNPTIRGPKQISTPVGVPVTIPFTYSPDVNAWTWTPAANLNCTDCANPAATLTFDQTYSVLVSDSNHCTDTASILIKTVCNEGNYFVPNTFSPNGDGVNDYFYPRGTSLYNIQSMTVFNRWGQMVFQRKNFPANAESMGWDGTFNGKPAPSDAYVYILEVICNNAQVIALRGNVTLIR